MTEVVCPSCSGPYLIGDPLGLRVSHTVACPLGRAEDSRVVADLDRGGRTFDRPATTAEKTLLAVVGFPTTTDTTCTVSYPSPSVRKRSFATPALDTNHGDAA